MSESKPFIKTLRSGITETIHRASIVAVQNNRLIYSHGDPNLILPLRSSAKPFMLFPLMDFVESNRIYLSEEQICVMASSHNGEKIHRDCVASILRLCNASYKDLMCGTHLPFYEFLYNDYFRCSDMYERQLFHNCSGKHAGMILLCKLLDIDTYEYWKQEHPVQKSITKRLKEYFEICSNDYFSLAMDGCGVPTYAVSLTKLAIAYQNMSTTDSMRNVFRSIISKPYMIAGQERIDTIITSELGYIAKSGSDGIFCINCPEKRIGIALKIESGNDDAAESAIVEVLEYLGLLTKTAKTRLESYRCLEIRTSTGAISGTYCPIV